MEFCFATFANCFIGGLQGDNTQVEIVKNLLQWAVDEPDVSNKNNDAIDISESFSNLLLKRGSEVHKNIKRFCSKPEVLPKAIKAMEQLLKKLNPFAEVTTFASIDKLIRDSENLSQPQKDELNKYKDTSRSEYLARILLLAISFPNRSSYKEIDSTDNELVNETGNKCPLCGQKLLLRKKGNLVKKFRVIKIFPKNASQHKSEFKDIEPPDDIDSLSNCIAVCPNCAEGYNVLPTRAEYEKLKSAKESFIRNRSIQDMIYSIPLDDGIKKVLDGLANNARLADNVEPTKLVLKLSSKLTDSLLLTETSSWVNNYYPFISRLFGDLDAESTGTFDKIRSSIRCAYEHIKTAIPEQAVIVDTLSSWVYEQSGVADRSLMRACRAIVSFFIQTCEVFEENEIAK